MLVKARRIGGSWVVALEAAMGAAGFTYGPGSGGVGLVYRPDRGVDQRIVSASHAQAKELLEEVGRHLEVLGETVVGRRLVVAQSVERIQLANGVRCIALAPNPRTIRGGKGDLILDEFGAMPHSKKVWAAAKAITDPTLARRYGYKLRVLGTPLGDDNMFHELACTDAGSRFSRHTVDIHDALSDGFPADVEALRAEAGDADMFAQEYECAFLSAASRYISSALYESCLTTIAEQPHQSGYRYAGMDIARSPHGDMSAMAELERLGTTLWQRGLVDARRGIPWDQQEQWVADVLQRCGRIALDATGLGNQFAERLVNAFGSRVEAVEFTSKSKEMLATGLRLAAERGQLKLLEEDVDLKRAVLSLRREITTAGNVRYSAPRTKAGHADHAWSLALAVHSAGQPVDAGVVDTSDYHSTADDIGDMF